MYVDIKSIELIKFNNCNGCSECCKNKLMAPLVLEDFEKVYKYFPILIAKFDILKPVMLLSNETACPYLRNDKCSIYENRPPACKIYPYSPWYDDILLDLSCKGVGVEGEILPLTEEGFKVSKFYEERFENITSKIKTTTKWLNKQTLNFYKTYHDIKLFTLKPQDIYGEIMQISLTHLYKYFH